MDKRKVIGALVIAIVVLTGAFLAIFCIEKVPRGYVGSIYSMRGGTADYTLSEGWHMVSPVKKVTEYSVATEQMLMSRNEKTGDSDDDESFNATCKDGVLNIDLEMSYHFEAEDIPKIAKKYRGLSGKDIVDTYIKSKAKTYVNEVMSQYSVLDAYMDKKSELNGEIAKALKEKLSVFGVVVESATIPRAQPEEAIREAINSRSQKAQEIEAAKQELEKQRIEAKTKVVEAQAEAKANRLKSAALSDKLLKQMELEARLKHGWITIQGGTPIVDAKN